MNSQKTWVWFLATVILSVGAVAGGCAVLRVDVDVYKGPLANDEVVQLQQFQSMAPGMHKVLERLQANLEGRDRERAAAVGEILSLFYDQIGIQLKPLKPYREFVEVQESAYRGALQLLQPSPNDWRRWEILSTAMKPPEAIIEGRVEANEFVSKKELALAERMVKDAKEDVEEKSNKINEISRDIERLNEEIRVLKEAVDEWQGKIRDNRRKAEGAGSLIAKQDAENLRHLAEQREALASRLEAEAATLEKRAAALEREAAEVPVDDARNKRESAKRINEVAATKRQTASLNQREAAEMRADAALRVRRATVHQTEIGAQIRHANKALDTVRSELTDKTAEVNQKYSALVDARHAADRSRNKLHKAEEEFASAKADRATHAVGERRLDELKTQYRELLHPGSKKRRSPGGIEKAYAKVTKIHGFGPRAKPEKPRSPNARFRRLTTGATNRHADLLYGDGSSAEKERFVRDVKAIGQAFHAARRALRELWERSLSTLVELDGLQIQSDRKDAIREAVAELLASLTQPERVAAVMADVLAPRSVREDLRTRLTAMSPKGFDWAPRTFRRNDFEVASTAVARALAKEPARMVENLLDADESFRKEYGFEEQRQYGVVRGPTLSGTDPLFREASNTLTATAGTFGLERGRHGKGVFTLTEELIDSERAYRCCDCEACDISAETAAQKCGQKSCNVAHKEVYNARAELTQALIHFAQKILSIANNDVLTTYESTGTAQPLASTDPSKAVTPDEFVTVLQAIGNTFMIQADELTARARHKTKLEERREADRMAFEYSLRRDAGQVLDDLLLVLGRKAGLGANADAHDEITSRTQTAQKEALRKAEAANGMLAEVTAKAVPAIYAHRTLTGLRTPIPGGFEEQEKPHALREDEEKLDAHIGGETGVSINELKNMIVQWVGSQIVDPPQESPRQKRLIATLGFFEALDMAGTEPQERAKTLAALTRRVEEHFRAAQEAVEYAAAAVVTRQRELKTAQQALVNVSLANQEAKSLKDTIETVRKLRNGIVNDAAALEIGKEPPSIFALLKDRVARDLRTNTPPTENTKETFERLTNAYSVLSAYRLPTGRTQIETLPDRKAAVGRGYDQRAVLDDLIAVLRYEDIEAARSGQRTHERVLETALKKAYEYRAGMVYIRPASSYLRSSYAANSLQGDPTLGWRNMLSRHTVRSLPFGMGEEFAGGDQKIQRIRTELDKQFWQNINSVRVAGGGTTNYALIKDDIGNWSVKSFSVDPESITKSALSLAMFNLGRSLNTDLLRVHELRAKPNKSDAEQRELNLLTERTTGAGSTMKRLFDHHENRYVDVTAAQYAQFATRTADVAFKGRIESAWKRSLQGTDPDIVTRISAVLERNGELLSAAQEKLGRHKRPNAVLTTGTASEIEANRQQRRRSAEAMGDGVVGAIEDLNAYRAFLISQATTEFGIAEQEKFVRAKTAELQGVEKKVAGLKGEIVQADNAVKDLQKIYDREEDQGKAQIEPDLTARQKTLEDKRAELVMVEEELVAGTAELGLANKTLALRKSQMRAVVGDVNRIVGSVILAAARDRGEAISAFEQAILFVGDSPDAGRQETTNDIQSGN